MKRQTLTTCGVALGLLLSLQAHAHHSRSPYQIDQTIEIVGTVSKVEWRNPHVYFELVGAAPSQARGTWVLEGHSVSGMIRSGWERETVQVGDQVLAVVNPPKNPEKRMGLIDHFAYEDGQAFYAFRPPPPGATGKAAGGNVGGAPPPQRDLDMRPSSDFSGNWNHTRSLRDLLLIPAPDFDLFPLTDKGRELARRYDSADNPSFRCEEPGLPRLIVYPYEHRWVREADRIVIEKEQASRAMIRTIYLDGRSPPADFAPSPIGFSVGRFEENGKVLVVETGQFAEAEWGLMRGIDSSSDKRLTERYRLLNGGMRMLVEYELEDPVYLTEPIKFVGVYDVRPDREFVWVDCDVGAASKHLSLEE